MQEIKAAAQEVRKRILEGREGESSGSGSGAEAAGAGSAEE